MSSPARITLVASSVTVATGIVSGLLIDERGGVAGAIAIVGAFVALAAVRRRFRSRPLGWVATVAAWAAFAWLVAVPVVYAVYLTHLPSRRAVHDGNLGRAKQPVALQGADGTALRGWYVPSRNGAAVIALHGTGSNRNGVAPHARMLARHG